MKSGSERSLDFVGSARIGVNDCLLVAHVVGEVLRRSSLRRLSIPIGLIHPIVERLLASIVVNY